MEWVTRMDMDKEWISGGYGYFFAKSCGVEWVMSKDTKMSAEYLLPSFFPYSLK